MLRRIFTLASAASLVLCLASVVLWIFGNVGEGMNLSRTRSYRVTVWTAGPYGLRYETLGDPTGRFIPMMGGLVSATPSGVMRELHIGVPKDPFPGVKVVSLHYPDSTFPFTIFAVTCDCWLPTTAFALLPFCWTVLTLRRKRAARSAGPGIAAADTI